VVQRDAVGQQARFECLVGILGIGATLLIILTAI
jgi:hypothetical protein